MWLRRFTIHIGNRSGHDTERKNRRKIQKKNGEKEEEAPNWKKKTHFHMNKFNMPDVDTYIYISGPVYPYIGCLFTSKFSWKMKWIFIFDHFAVWWMCQKEHWPLIIDNKRFIYILFRLYRISHALQCMCAELKFCPSCQLQAYTSLHINWNKR